MFIRIQNKIQRREMLVNVNHISTIEVLYAAPDPSEDGMYWRTSLEAATTDPSTMRFYRIGLGGEDALLLRANPDDPVAKIFGDIYKNAIG